MGTINKISEAPLVSIIVPSFNQGRFIERTILSILRQKYRPIEIIIVDGASTDETIDIVKSYASENDEIRWLSESDNGPADAVNKGLKMARGEIIGIQSSDDMYYADAISMAVKSFRDNASCGMIYGDSDSIDTQDRILSHYEVPEFSWSAMFGISLCLAQQSIFFRADISKQVGYWNGAYYGCDLDYWLRLMQSAPTKKINVTFSAWRSYPEQRTQPSHYQKILLGYEAMLSDNKLLKKSSVGMKLMARASMHLMALRFHPTGNIWSKRLHALKTLFLAPNTIWHCPKELLLPLIPGYSLLRKLYRRFYPVKLQVSARKVEPGMTRPA